MHTVLTIAANKTGEAANTTEGNVGKAAIMTLTNNAG